MTRRAPHLVILVGAVIALAFGTAGPASAAPPVAARWSVTVAPASLLTGPALGGGRVYVGFGAPDGTGGVRALDVATGATLWTRTLPLPVTVPPVFVPSSTRLYAGTSERLYGLDPATGRTIVAGPVTGFEDLYSLHYADGRVYVQTTHDIFAFTAAATPLWDYFLDDDPSVLSAPGDGFLYVNDEQDDGSGGFPQCMEKVDAAKGTLVALNCAIQDFIPPTAVPSRSTVAGAGSAGVFGFRTSNLKQRWLNTRFSLGYATNATPAFGGVVAASLGERMALLRLSDGTKLCEKTFDERSFSSILPPVFDPGSGGVYLFDQVAKDVYKASSTCQQAWVYLADDDVAGFAASSSTVVGAGGRTVFALNP